MIPSVESAADWLRAVTGWRVQIILRSDGTYRFTAYGVDIETGKSGILRMYYPEDFRP